MERGIEKRGKRDQKFKNLFDNRHSTASYHVLEHKCFRKEPSAPSLTKKRQKRHFSDCCFGWWCCGSSFSCTKQQTVFDMTFLKIVTPIFFVVWRRRLLSLMSDRYLQLNLIWNCLQITIIFANFLNFFCPYTVQNILFCRKSLHLI